MISSAEETNYVVFIVSACVVLFLLVGFILYFVLGYRSKQQNVMLLEEQKRKMDEQNLALEKALHDLKATQQQLIHAEKMASLGELTAGIAHEIQNPLNFVKNFSELSSELISEMKEAAQQQQTDEILAIASDLAMNMEKISYHGERAGSIVKGMLQHSRNSASNKELTDLNALTDEYLRLSFHGLRAKDKSFNSSYDLQTDASLEKINIVPQEIGRVILNIVTNAFYAVNEKHKKEGSSSTYKPMVKVSTQQLPGFAKIRIEDNGSGISDEYAQKIFQPFFTTKPTGSGTGLGLSISYEIITQGHNGKIELFNHLPEGGTAFDISLPL